MSERDVSSRGADTRARTRRDLERLRHRSTGGQFWRSLALVGSVGWPIVLLATGGALLGGYLDGRFGTGVRFTLGLVSIGAAIGTAIAFRSLRENGR